MSGLFSLLDDFDLSAPSSRKGAPMNAMKHGGVPSASSGRRSFAPSGTDTNPSSRGIGDAFDALFGSGATTAGAPSATPGAPSASDFFASPRMNPPPGATPARTIPSPTGGDPFCSLGVPRDGGLFGSFGGGSAPPGGGTPMSSMGRHPPRFTKPAPPVASPASEDILGAIFGDTGGGSFRGAGFGSRNGEAGSDFQNVANPTSCTAASSVGGSTTDLSGLEQFASSGNASSRGGSSSNLANLTNSRATRSAPNGFAGFEDFVTAAPVGEKTVFPKATRACAEHADLDDFGATGGRAGDWAGAGVSSQRRSRTESRTESRTASRSASEREFDVFGGDASSGSPELVSSPDFAGAGEGSGFAGLEDFVSPRPVPSGSQKQYAPQRPRPAEVTSLDAGLEAMLGELSSLGGNKWGGHGFNGGGPVIIDDMFGPAMGSGFRGDDAGGVASTISGRVVSADVAYESSDDEGHEGDSEVRKAARAKRHERNRARIVGKLQEKRDRETAAIAEQAERQVMQDLIGADIDDWLRKNQNNIRAMLANLADVLWQGHGYKSPDLNDLLSPNNVKKSYHKALVIVHPDKVRQKFGGDMDKVFVADKVFDQVRDAYSDFAKKEL